MQDDIKAIRADIGEIKTCIAVNTVSLDNHIKRTDIAERRLEKLEYSLVGLLVTVVGAALVKWLIS